MLTLFQLLSLVLGTPVVSNEGKVLVFLWLRAWEETEKHILMIMKCDKDELGVEGRL